MALQGTIKDFGLADILQLIGIQRKTGVLSLKNDDERVQLKFLEGNVVGAESGGQSTEDLLGSVLVRTGRITEEQLAAALATQKRTLQRLGHILVKRGCLTEESLVEALRVQSLQIIFRLFRWRDGSYQIQMVEDLDYDEQHATPISSETILMEGARMIDEWPIIERRIRSEHVVLEKTEAALGLEPKPAPAVPSLLDSEAELDFIFDPDLPEEPAAEEGAVRLSETERQLLELIDGKSTVGTISELSSIGEFETYRALADLVARDLLRVVEKVRQAPSARRQRPWIGRLIGACSAAVLAAAIGATLFTLHANPHTPWKALEHRELQGLREYAAMSRLERIEEAIRVFYLDTGIFPATLDQLAGDYLRGSDLLDPWGRVYGFSRDANGFRVYGRDAAGEPVPDLSVIHRFTPVQQMMIESAADPTP